MKTTRLLSMVRPSRLICWLGVALITLPISETLAAQHFSKGFGAAYGGGSKVHRGGVRPSNGRIHHRRSHYRQYSHYPRYHGGYHRYPFHYSNFYYPRPFPYPEPRIYVYPQSSSGSSSGRRVLNVISMPPRHIDEVVPGPMDFSEEAEVDSTPVTAPPKVPQPATPGEAWNQLQEGQSRQALSSFAGLASANPDEGLYKIGYGLAAAMNGDKITASYALRRAFESKPESAAYTPIAGPMKDRLKQLTLDYREWVRKQPENMNARFLFAVTSHFLHQDEAAKACIDEAVERGDVSLSMARLGEAVGKSLDDMNGESNVEKPQ